MNALSTLALEDEIDFSGEQSPIIPQDRPGAPPPPYIPGNWVLRIAGIALMGFVFLAVLAIFKD